MTSSDLRDVSYELYSDIQMKGGNTVSDHVGNTTHSLADDVYQLMPNETCSVTTGFTDNVNILTASDKDMLDSNTEERLVVSPPQVEDVGLSAADETERKLQCSLDELIEQSQDKSVNQSSSHYTHSGRGGGGGRRGTRGRTHSGIYRNHGRSHKDNNNNNNVNINKNINSNIVSNKNNNNASMSHNSVVSSTNVPPPPFGYPGYIGNPFVMGPFENGMASGLPSVMEPNVTAPLRFGAPARGIYGIRRAPMVRAQPYDVPIDGSLLVSSKMPMGRRRFGPMYQQPQQAQTKIMLMPELASGFPMRNIPSAPVVTTTAAAGVSGVNNTRGPPGIQNSATAADMVLSEIEILFPPMVQKEDNTGEIPSSTDSLVVKFKGTEVLTVKKPRGEMVLSSGGWKTLSTRLVLNTALKPLGLWIETSSGSQSEPSSNTTTSLNSNHSPENVAMSTSTVSYGAENTNNAPVTSPHNTRGTSQWTVADGCSYLAAFYDGIIIGQIGGQSHCHLLARSSVIAQHLRQVKSNAMARRQRFIPLKNK